MCGINVLLSNFEGQYENHFNSMLESSAHRGPDNCQQQALSINSTKILIGVNRLKILDFSDKANQPMSTSDGKYTLAFNGAIYNYQKLRNQLLEEKVEFQTHSDTEVVLHWLAQKGPKGIASMQGMFALAFIDVPGNNLILARDRHGMKPLYYWQGAGTFLVSSEIRSLLASGLVKKEINAEQIDHYFFYKYAHPPATFINHIYSLLPGHYLQYDLKTGKATSGSFTSKPVENPVIPNPPDVRQLIEDSLLKHIHADVPVGLMLSGGVDSTLLLALAQKIGYSVPSFSIVNRKSEAQFGPDDYKFARLAANQYGPEHELMELDGICEEDFHNYINHVDQPIADSGALMTYLISQKAQKSVKILLSGAGADEYFAGYNRHAAFRQYLKYRPLFVKASKFVGLLTNLDVAVGKKPRLYQKMFKSIDEDPIATYFNMLKNPDWRQPEQKWQNIQPYPSESEDLISWALSLDRHHYLPEDVLAMSDGMSMANSIEMRMPYLDDPLVNYMQKIQGDELLKHGKKWILKEILDSLGGKIFTKRPKEGFGLPLSKWLNQKEHGYLWEVLEKRDDYVFELVDWETFSRLKAAHHTNKADHGQALWSVIVLAHWMKSVLD